MKTPRERNLLLVPLALVVAAAGLAACGDSNDGGSDDAAAASTSDMDGATVTVKTFAFGPDPLEVPTGTVVTFVNETPSNTPSPPALARPPSLSASTASCPTRAPRSSSRWTSPAPTSTSA